jgi:hypothetical protein
MEKYQIFALVILSSVLVLWIVFLRLRKKYHSWKRRRRFDVGRDAEDKAFNVLQRHGYQIIDDQCTRTAFMLVDGARHEYKVRVDFIVEAKDGRRYAAEVKSGAKAPNPLHSPTRRQLLEYQAVYEEVAGILLVDMSEKVIKAIEFPRVGH